MKKLLKDLSGLTAWKTYAYFLGGAPALNTKTNVALRPLDDTSAKAEKRGAQRPQHGDRVPRRRCWRVFAWSGYLVQYLVLWVLPLVTVVQAILRLRAIAEHGATTDFSSPLTAARTNVAPAWLEWLIFPHHVNYHIEHHLYASVPHYNLPALHREMRAHGVLEGAEVVAFRVTLGKIFAERPLARELHGSAGAAAASLSRRLDSSAHVAAYLHVEPGFVRACSRIGFIGEPTNPTRRYIACARSFCISVSSVMRSTPSARACAITCLSSAAPMPRLRCSGAVTRSSNSAALPPSAVLMV